jgi:UDP-GlcNAc:undecaprenyl-phosphate GlcNAc-1-phosphate transferase
MVAVNAWNYLDHADGVFATAGSIAAAILATAALRISVTPAAAIAAGLCGSLAAYLVWNAPPARIFLGDAGSLPIGFLMVLVSAAIIDRGGLASAPSVLGSHALPIMDAGLVTFVRLHEGRDPFRGGREHTAHRLIARTGARGALAVVALAGSALGAAGLLGWGCPIAAIAWIAAAMVGGAILLARIPPRPEDSSVPPRSTFAGGGGARPV